MFHNSLNFLGSSFCLPHLLFILTLLTCPQYSLLNDLNCTSAPHPVISNLPHFLLYLLSPNPNPPVPPLCCPSSHGVVGVVIEWEQWPWSATCNPHSISTLIKVQIQYSLINILLAAHLLAWHPSGNYKETGSSIIHQKKTWAKNMSKKKDNVLPFYCVGIGVHNWSTLTVPPLDLPPGNLAFTFFHIQVI